VKQKKDGFTNKMARKDWNEIQTNKFKGTVSFTRKDEQDNVTVRYNDGFLKPWEAVYGKVGEPKNKFFKTKQSAINFAKSYMRSH